MRACLVALSLLLVPSALPSRVRADDPAPHTHVLAPFIIHGRRQQPSVFVMLTRTRPRFDRAEPDHHAVDRIVDSVRHDPF